MSFKHLDQKAMFFQDFKALIKVPSGTVVVTLRLIKCSKTMIYE